MRACLLSLALLAALAAGCGDAPSAPPAGATKAAPGRSSPAPTPPAGPGGPPAPPGALQTVAPEFRTRVEVLETSGKVQFNEERIIRVNAPVTGRVLEVLARVGDVVEPGHRLLVLDSPDLGAAKSDYAKAVSDLERSEAALQLARELLEVKAIARKEIRQAENDYQKAVAEKERAASRLRTLGVPEAQFKDIAARADAATRVVVTAPGGGVLVEVNVRPGQVVSYGQSDTPTSLFVIADLSTMWVLADVYEPDVPRVRLGQAVTVRLPCCPKERYEGRVAYISDAVDPQTRTLKVRALVPTRGRILKAEMFVKVAITTGSANLLVIPQSAVHRENGETFVLVETAKGAYQRRPVKLGAELNGFVEVQEGVTPRDRVVSTGSILLKKTAK